MPRLPKSLCRTLFLLLTLLVALALAAALKSHVQHQQNVQLASPQSLGPFTLRPPTNWLIHPAPNSVALEEPPVRNSGRRKIDVALATSPRFLSPLEYLVRSGDLPLHTAAALLTTQPTTTPLPAIQPITIANFPGILVSQTRLFRVPNLAQPLQSKQILAATILPSNQVIVLRLEGVGPVSAADEKLVRRLGESIFIADQPASIGGPTLEFPDNIHVTFPKSLQTFPTANRFQVSRTLVCTGVPGHFAVELTPAVVLSKDPAAELLSMLMLRDPGFHATAVRKLDEQTFTCLRRPDDLFPAAVYLRVNPDGRAILAEFRYNTPAPADELSQIDSLWRQIAAGLEFTETSSVPALFRAGTAARQELPNDLATLLPTQSSFIEYWQWADDTVPNTGFSTIHYGFDPTSLFAIHDADRSPLAPHLGRELIRWRLARDGSAYDRVMIRATPTGALALETHLGSRKLTSIVRQGPTVIAKATGPVPELFIPGPILPFALARLPFQPMILQTDSLSSPDPLACALPLTIFIEPAFDAPKTFPNEKEPMRCWSVRVNGASHSSRWYYDPRGRLHSITYSNNLRTDRLDSPSNTPE